MVGIPGRVFRRVNRAGRVWGESMTEKVVWHVVREFAAKASIEKLAPHDLRRYAESRIMPNARTLTTIYRVAAVNGSA
jgi:hypothetical protein